MLGQYFKGSLIFVEIALMYNIVLVSGVLHSDLTFANYELITMASLVTTCPNTKLGQYH